jgi:signal peptide peptidase SppA
MSDFDPLFVQLNPPAPPRYLHILSALENRPWAIRQEEFELMHRIVQEHSQPDFVSADLEAVAAKLGRPLENTGGQVEMRGSTAVLAIQGPLFRYANLMTALSGATSVEMSALAFDAALDNPAVQQIILKIDSPGGEVAGINAFADQIRAGAVRKPVIAYLDSLGASAAYWLASAARQIVADESAQIGSIGVVATQTDRTGAQERQGIKSYKIISSQSPRKHPDAGTEAGRSQLQTMVDEMAALFIGKVAEFRGIDTAKVLSDFGQGSVMMAPRALEAGMIDQISGFEPFLQTLDPRSVISFPAAAAALEEVPMAETSQPLALPAATPPSASTSPPSVPVPSSTQIERERIRAILESPEAQGREALARHLALQTEQTSEAARAILSNAHVAVVPVPQSPGAPNAFERAMSAIPNPVVGVRVNAEEEDQSVNAEAARILQWIRKPQSASV